MTVYQELQLNQAGSKALIRQSVTPQEKRRHSIIYLFKIVLTLAFCVGFVTAFGLLFGQENGTAGVVVLLFLLAFRQADLGIKASHGAGVMLLIYAILITGPRIANMLPVVPAFIVHLCSIFLLTLLSCQQVRMCNQATIVMAYLLLFGYDVTGKAYAMRVVGMTLGGLWTAWLLYRSHKNKTYKEGFLDLFRQFSMETERSRWQAGMALTVACAVLAGELLHLPRVMWIGFAALSTTQMAMEDRVKKAKFRFIGVLVGAPLVFLLMQVLPENMTGFLGIFGGLCIGFCAHYGWQSIFNCFGAVYMAVGILGSAQSAAFYRVVDTGFGIVFALLFYGVVEKILMKFGEPKYCSEGAKS